MSIEKTILGILKPRIKPVELKIIDQESDGAKEKLGNGVEKPFRQELSKTLGALFPLIQIRNIRIDYEHLSFFELDLFNRIPRLNLVFNDAQGKFNIESPLDGDIISVYLKAPHVESQRPIRIDFDILDIDSDPKSKTFSVSGIMKIPNIFKETCKGLKENTSFEHLLSLAEELGIGFASNITSTSDSMTRLLPYITYEEFINETVQNAYSDDKSFFDWFIDPFYYLCFVNVNNQITTELEPQEVNITSSANFGANTINEDVKDSFTGPLILTNDPKMGTFNVFISNWSLKSSFASKWIKSGYSRIMQFFDIDEKNSESEYLNKIKIESLTTTGAENSFILLKGKSGDDFYKNQTKYKWMGKQISNSVGGAVHDNYLYANVLNFQNNTDLTKMNLSVLVNGLNLNIYKYMSIPVHIYEGGNEKINKLKQRDKDLGEDDNLKTFEQDDDLGTDIDDKILNKFISGNYLVTGLSYVYTKGNTIKTKLQLSRREWSIPANNENIS